MFNAMRNNTCSIQGAPSGHVCRRQEQHHMAHVWYVRGAPLPLFVDACHPLPASLPAEHHKEQGNKSNLGSSLALSQCGACSACMQLQCMQLDTPGMHIPESPGRACSAFALEKLTAQSRQLLLHAVHLTDGAYLLKFTTAICDQAFGKTCMK